MSVVDLDLSTASMPVDGAVFFTTERGNAVVVHVRGEVDATDTLILTGVLEAALRRSGGALVVDLSAVTSFDVLPLAVLAKYRARIASEGGLFRIVVADTTEGPLADLDPRRWNMVTASAEAAAAAAPWSPVQPSFAARKTVVVIGSLPSQHEVENRASVWRG